MLIFLPVPQAGHSFRFPTVRYRAFHLYYIPGAPKNQEFQGLLHRILRALRGRNTLPRVPFSGIFQMPKTTISCVLRKSAHKIV
jgi:hypothetical protein